MKTYDVTRCENRKGGHSEHIGTIDAPSEEFALAWTEGKLECPETCRLIVSECDEQPE